VLSGRATDVLPVLPILHTGLAPLCGVPLGRFFSDAAAMADVLVQGYRRFGYDGIQLTLGVTGEAEALGAKVEQPADAGPVLREHLLSDPAALASLRDRDPAIGGRLPVFFEAVERVVQMVGDEAFVLPILRGPLLIASQLRGVEDVLVDLLERPEATEELLDFTTDVVIRVAEALLPRGAHGLSLGEATCSPNFISPDLYRRLVLPRHRRLVTRLKQMGWPFVGLHICGNIVPIVEDLISAGVDYFDVDYQVPAVRAIEAVRNRVALRGNLDPSSVLRFGTPQRVAAEAVNLREAVAGARWIASSGCDIPPGTSAECLSAFVRNVRPA
jgi:uroporphyrinogen decarboxylase